MKQIVLKKKKGRNIIKIVIKINDHNEVIEIINHFLIETPWKVGSLLPLSHNRIDNFAFVENFEITSE